MKHSDHYLAFNKCYNLFFINQTFTREAEKTPYLRLEMNAKIIP